jgi:hypothetical protein
MRLEKNSTPICKQVFFLGSASAQTSGRTPALALRLPLAPASHARLRGARAARPAWLWRVPAHAPAASHAHTRGQQTAVGDYSRWLH